MLTLDTSGLIALLNLADQHHDEAVSIFDGDPGPYFIPAAILAEIAYMLERRIGPAPVLTVIEDLERGAYTLDCGEEDLGRVRDLMQRYQDLQLGLADAAVAACAERHGGHVLTTDRRHFPVLARGEGTVIPLPS